MTYETTPSPSITPDTEYATRYYIPPPQHWTPGAALHQPLWNTPPPPPPHSPQHWTRHSISLGGDTPSQGVTTNVVQCVNIDFESRNKEAFYDLQLNVKGCKNIYDAFEQYVAVEMLDGDNKYLAEGKGLQVCPLGRLSVVLGDSAWEKP